VHRSGVPSFLKSLLRKRWLRWTLFAAGGLAATYFGREWWAERQWQQYAAEARARGVKLTVAELFDRPPVPAEENFAELPIWRAWRAGTKTLPRIPEGRPMLSRVRLLPGRPVFDLEKFRRGMVERLWLTGAEAVGSDAEIVVRGLRKVDAELQEIVQGASRPYARFPFLRALGGPFYDSNLNRLFPVLQYLELKFHAELALGHGDIALAHWQAGWPLVQAAADQSTTMQLAAIMARRLVDAVWAGLDRQALTDAQLLAIEHRLASESFLRNFQATLDGDRAEMNREIEGLAADRNVANLIPPSQPDRLLLWLYSRQNQWWRKNQLWFNRHLDEVAASVDVRAERWIPPAEPKYDPQAIPGDWRGLDLGLARLWSYRYRVEISLYEHVNLRLAGLACALERFRLGTGAYPDTLRELVPKFLAELPHEPTNGEPFRYRREEKEGYVLYSIGLDGIDDGGLEPGPNFGRGDWRWWAPRAVPKAARQP